MQNKKPKSGYTLIEVLIAVILVGLAIASLVAANSAFTKANGEGTNLTTAVFLTEQMKERTVLFEYAALPSLDERVFSPPIGIDGQSLTSLTAFSQKVIVENVDPADFGQVVDDGSSSFLRVTVTVFLNSRQLNSASWIRAQY